MQKRDFAAAESRYRAGVEMLRATADRTPWLADSLHNLGRALFSQGELGAAGDAFSEALAVYEACKGENDSRYFLILNDVAHVWFRDERFREAEDAFRRVAQHLREAEGGDSPRTLVADAMRAECAWKLGDLTHAEEELLRCFKRLVETKGEDFPQARGMAAHLVRFYEETGRADQAERYRAIAGKKSPAASR